MADHLAFAEDVQAVRREEPLVAQLLLDAQRELLEERVMRVWRDGDDAYAARLAGPAKRSGKSGATGSENGAGSKAQVQAGGRRARARAAREGALRATILRYGECTVVLNALLTHHFKNEPVVIDAVAAPNYRLALSEWIVGKADARAEVLFVRAMMQIDHVRNPYAGQRGFDGQVGARAGIGVRAGEVGIVFPTQAKIQREIRANAPVVLDVACDVVVAHMWNRNVNPGRAALNRNSDGNVQVVHLAIAVEVREAEVRGENHGAAAEDVDEAVRVIILKFAAEAQRVFTKSPGKAIAKLIAIHVRGLGRVEIGSVGKVGKQQLVRETEGWIGDRRVIGEGGNVVEKLVEVEGYVVYL